MKASSSAAFYPTQCENTEEQADVLLCRVPDELSVLTRWCRWRRSPEDDTHAVTLSASEPPEVHPAPRSEHLPGTHPCFLQWGGELSVCVGGVGSYLVGTLHLPLQLHLVLPLPQHLLAEGRQARPGVLQLGRTA